MKIVVGISGASGAILGYKMVKALKECNIEVHLVVSEGAKITWNLETDIAFEELIGLADYVYDNKNLGATIASGSFRVDGTIIIPCSMKSLSAIATGYADTLLVRAVDVSLKENRKVIIVPREMPLGKIHMKNLKEASDLGCVIVPPMLTLYNGANTIEEQINHIIGKILMQFGLEFKKFVPWNGKGVR